MGKIFGNNVPKAENEIKLSVIVPIYGVEQYLPKCIESIIKQKYKQLEILLIDDGSPDQCPQICDKYAEIDSRIKVIHKKNEGLVRARKTGINEATGKYITFVDGDDWIDAGMYMALMELLETSGADFIDSGFFYDRNGIIIDERRLKRGIYILNEYNRHRAFLALLDLDYSVNIKQHVWSKIFKSDVIRASYANVPDDRQYGEDAVNMLYCVLKSNKMVQIEDIFYHYNCREESMSHLKPIPSIRKSFELWSYCGKIILENDRFMTQEEIDTCLFKRLYTSFRDFYCKEFDVIQYYSFPHIEKLFGKKVVIYGAGRVGRDYLTQLSKYEKCKIVCWVDRNYKNLDFKYWKVIGVERMKERIYDIVLIAVEQQILADEIKKTLLKSGIPENKILWHKPKVFC